MLGGLSDIKDLCGSKGEAEKALQDIILIRALYSSSLAKL